MQKRVGVSFSVSCSPIPSPSSSPPCSPLFSCSPILPEFESPLFSSPARTVIERIIDLLDFLLYVLLKPLVWFIYQNSVKGVHKHWDHSHKVNLKLGDLNEKLKEYGIGPGSVFLYSAEGNNLRGLFRFIIKGLTDSRYSHAMMLVPHPKDSDDFAVWQSGISHPIKLGGGHTNSGPDIADMRELITVFNKRYNKSRFVFRPLKSSLSSVQQQKIHESIEKVMDNKDIYFPMNVFKIFWSWTLSNKPTLASLAGPLGLDYGVMEDKYGFMFCSMLVTRTLIDIGVLDPSTKPPQYAPGDYGLPCNKVPVYGDEYEFIFDDLEC